MGCSIDLNPRLADAVLMRGLEDPMSHVIAPVVVADMAIARNAYSSLQAGPIVQSSPTRHLRTRSRTVQLPRYDQRIPIDRDQIEEVGPISTFSKPPGSSAGASIGRAAPQQVESHVTQDGKTLDRYLCRMRLASHMDYRLSRVKSWHGNNTQTLPERRERRGMGVRRSLSDPVDRGRQPASVQSTKCSMPFAAWCAAVFPGE